METLIGKEIMKFLSRIISDCTDYFKCISLKIVADSIYWTCQRNWRV